MTAELMETLVDHSAGNYRLLMTMGGELLAYGMAHEVAQLDEKCYLEVYQPRSARPALEEESEGVKMPVSADQVLPVVRVGEIRSEATRAALACGRALGGKFGWRDRRRPQVRQDMAGAGHGPLRGHGHAVPGQVRRAGAGSGPGLSGRGRAADGARTHRGNGTASRSRSRPGGDLRDHGARAPARSRTGSHAALGDSQAATAQAAALGSLGATSRHRREPRRRSGRAAGVFSFARSGSSISRSCWCITRARTPLEESPPVRDCAAPAIFMPSATRTCTYDEPENT